MNQNTSLLLFAEQSEGGHSHSYCMTQLAVCLKKKQLRYLPDAVYLGCRYLYRHNYTISVPEVYYEVNRPDLNALYVNQLIQRDFSTQGSTDDWVKYLTTSESSHLEC